MAEESDAPFEEGEGKPKKSKLLLFVIIGLGTIVLAGGGFFAYSTFFASKPTAITDDLAAGKTSDPQKIIGETMAMSPFIVNLADPKGKRYLKVTIEIEFEDQTALERAQKATPKLRDTVIMMLTSLAFEDVMTPEGKVRIRDELLERFNQALKPDRINNIYFTEFVVQ